MFGGQRRRYVKSRQNFLQGRRRGERFRNAQSHESAPHHGRAIRRRLASPHQPHYFGLARTQLDWPNHANLGNRLISSIIGMYRCSEMLSIEQRIERRAYELYVQRGNQWGSELEDWLQAEAEVRQAQEDGVNKD
jgi:hypothetical protein